MGLADTVAGAVRAALNVASQGALGTISRRAPADALTGAPGASTGASLLHSPPERPSVAEALGGVPAGGVAYEARITIAAEGFSTSLSAPAVGDVVALAGNSREWRVVSVSPFTVGLKVVAWEVRLR